MGHRFKVCTQILLEKEIIYAEDLEAIFGKRQWISRSQEILEISKNMRPDDNIIRSKPQEVNPFADVNLNSASTPRFSKEGEETKVEKFSENEKDIDISEKEE